MKCLYGARSAAPLVFFYSHELGKNYKLGRDCRVGSVFLLDPFGSILHYRTMLLDGIRWIWGVTYALYMAIDAEFGDTLA